MAEDEEREHLLSFEDGDEEPRTRRRNKSPSDRSHTTGQSRLRSDVSVDGNPSLLTAPGPPNILQYTTENDYVVAVFVVAFDTKAGNLIEWRIPEDVDLDGVEFKAMASGSHTLKTDFVYFRKDNLFGLACFENMPVDSRSERGARMKSVGILATSYTLLYRHMQFLENQVRFQLFHSLDLTDGANTNVNNFDRHQLEVPGRYSQLRAFWEDKKGTLPRSSVAGGGRSPLSTGSSPCDILPADLKVTHPAKCFTYFMQFFGRQTLILWKFALLGKRILFFSPPPIGDVCYRVYCCCCLANHSMHRPLMTQGTKPHFYINVADIDNLESEVSYIACTTEKIFETKPRLYDVYVDNQNVTTKSAAMKDLLKISAADQEKFEKLNNLRNPQPFTDISDDADNEEDLFTSFFMDLNNRIFQTLIDVSQSQDRQLTSEHMKVMGLDPSGDRPFLMELVETYGIDVMLIVDNPCCPT